MLKDITRKIVNFLGYDLVKIKSQTTLEVISKYTTSKLDPNREKSGLNEFVLKSIQNATFNYKYKGINCIKNPFDIAIYTKLIYDLQPKTIVEVGSAYGGSALWFADQLRNFNIDGKIYSLDIELPVGVIDPIVTFLAGNIYELQNSELPGILERAERPLLVIEDGPHRFESCVCALNFFDQYLSSGEYIVIEDGIVNDLGKEYEKYENGPNKAIATFLNNHPGKYIIDYNLCDYYGHNFTWNTNGYLRKV